MNVPFIDENNGSVEILSDGSDGLLLFVLLEMQSPLISLLDALW